MARFYFDASALVKRYVAETGTGWVRSITDPAQGHDIYVVRVTAVEVVSALVRQSPPLPNLVAALADFKFDLRKQYQRLAITNAVINTGMRLVEAYRLRAYDALQLATAVELHQGRAGASAPPLTFVCADLALKAAAVKEGLLVDDPNAHP